MTYYHKDHLGSTTATSDCDGILKESTKYNPYGSARTGSDITETDYKFTDQEEDVETGLYNYDARLYDPVLGVFITTDSIVQGDGFDPQMLNRYTYCRNNPLIYTDPTGHYIPEIGPGNHTTDENVTRDIIERLDSGRGFDNYEEVMGEHWYDADIHNKIREAKFIRELLCTEAGIDAFSEEQAQNLNGRAMLRQGEAFGRSYAEGWGPSSLKVVGKAPAAWKWMQRFGASKKIPTWVRKALGAFPEKMNRGQLQPYNPKGGGYLNKFSNLPVQKRYVGGFAAGYADAKGIPGEAQPIGLAGRMGYYSGQIIGNIF